MDYRVNELEAMSFVMAEGTSREGAQATLDLILQENNIEPLGYYYMEVFMGDTVAGAMAMAKVEEEPEKSKKINSSTIQEGPYMIMNLTYEEYKKSHDPKSEARIDLNALMKKEGYRLATFPFFEVIEDSKDNMIRVFVPLK